MLVVSHGFAYVYLGHMEGGFSFARVLNTVHTSRSFLSMSFLLWLMIFDPIYSATCSVALASITG